MDHFDLLAPLYDRAVGSGGPQRLLPLLALAPSPAANPGPEAVRHDDDPLPLLLDVGGGTGRVAQTLTPYAQVVLADPSAGMLSQARAKGLRAVRCAAERLPFAAGAFARVLLVDSFHHLADQRAALGEALRVLELEEPPVETGATGPPANRRPGSLKPGFGETGRLVIEEMDIRRWTVKLIAFVERLVGMRSRLVSLPDMERLAISLGGEIVAREEGVDISVRLAVRLR